MNALLSVPLYHALPSPTLQVLGLSLQAMHALHIFEAVPGCGEPARAGVACPLCVCAGVLAPDGPYALGGGRSFVDSPFAAAVIYALIISITSHVEVFATCKGEK